MDRQRFERLFPCVSFGEAKAWFERKGLDIAEFGDNQVAAALPRIAAERRYVPASPPDARGRAHGTEEKSAPPAPAPAPEIAADYIAARERRLAKAAEAKAEKNKPTPPREVSDAELAAWFAARGLDVAEFNDRERAQGRRIAAEEKRGDEGEEKIAAFYAAAAAAAGTRHYRDSVYIRTAIARGERLTEALPRILADFAAGTRRTDAAFKMWIEVWTLWRKANDASQVFQVPGHPRRREAGVITSLAAGADILGRALTAYEDAEQHPKLPSSGWVLIGWLSVTVGVIDSDRALVDVYNGAAAAIPDALRWSRWIHSFPGHDDTACFWRCLAVFQGANPRKCNLPARRLAEAFYKRPFRCCADVSPFNWDDLGAAEIAFELRISVYKWSAGRWISARLSPRIPLAGIPLMVLGYLPAAAETGEDPPKWEAPAHGAPGTGVGHFVLVRDFERAINAGIYCGECGQRFQRPHNLARHTLNGCRRGQTRLVFPAAPIDAKPSTPRPDGVRLHVIGYDFEAAIGDRKTAHVPVSVTIRDTLDRLPTWLTDADPARLVLRFWDEIKRRGALCRADSMASAGLVGPGPHPLPIWEMTTTIPVIGFNSNRYDLNLIWQYLVGTLHAGHLSAIKRGSTYKFIVVGRKLCPKGDNLGYEGTFRLLDAMLYLAPGTNLKAFLKSWKTTAAKSRFPYESLVDYSCLAGPIPARWGPDGAPAPAWRSSLKTVFSPSDLKEELEELQAVDAAIELHGFATLGQWLEYYNDLDVGPFLEALGKMREAWREQDGIDIFLDCATLASASYLSTVRKTLARRPQLMSRKNYVAAAAAMAALKRLRRDDLTPKQRAAAEKARAFGLLVNKVETIPALAALMTASEAHDIFSPGRDEYRMLCDAKQGGPAIIFTRYAEVGETRIREGGAVPLGAVVGFDANALYLGCTGMEMPVGLPRRDGDLATLVSRVLSGRFFGVAVVTIRVPPRLLDGPFSDLAPFFVAKPVPWEAVSPQQQEIYRRRHGGADGKGDTLKLIDTPRAVQHPMISPMLRWCLEHGCEVETVHEAWAYGKARPFEWFTRAVTEARSAADKDAARATEAELQKLKGNSFYGMTIVDVERFSVTSYLSGAGLRRAVGSPYFHSATMVTPYQAARSEEVYEVDSRKPRTEVGKPVAVGIFVYQYAKLRILEFVHDFIARYIPRANWEPLEMDTDSFYIGLGGSKAITALIDGSLPDPQRKENFTAVARMVRAALASVVRAEDREAFEQAAPRFLAEADADRRTPGLFKVETVGDGFVGLCAKSYCVRNGKGPLKDKVIAKGVDHRQNDHNFALYKATLFAPLDAAPHKADSRGFRLTRRPGEGVTVTGYDAPRLGLSNAYDKRRVRPDGIHTLPHDFLY